MKEEPFFLVNEFLEHEKKELEEIVGIVKGGTKYKSLEKSVFLKNFTNSLFKAYRKTRKPKEDTKKIKEDLMKKKQEILNKIKSSTVLKEASLPPKEIILSKETGKTLVTTNFNGVVYSFLEPELKDQDKKLLEDFETFLKTTPLEDKLLFSNKLKELCLVSKIEYTESYQEKIRYYVSRDLKKYGLLSPLLEDVNVKEIVCSGKGRPLTIRYKDKQDIQTNLTFSTDQEINKFITLLADKAHQKISVENPFLTLDLDQFKIQATFGSEFITPKFVIIKN